MTKWPRVIKLALSVKEVSKKCLKLIEYARLWRNILLLLDRDASELADLEDSVSEAGDVEKLLEQRVHVASVALVGESQEPVL